ncbi:hypothetical protein [Spirosoma rhododendri]|uniref:Lipoprotein n=1 Tax=Spirosoma rhododendri TaxID=2728024 RepID=A0A7L5DTG4_9BACT|nr:hypothetical protein [Spirosoma rhododendri]QJD78850.1 hypothetical protein HH216_10725 [Spirosoma rhododendri]
MRLSIGFVALFALTISSCSDPAKSDQPPVYFDVLGYVRQQIAGLSAQKPLVNKDATINKEHSHHSTRDIDWARELDLFTQADINKPALRSSYRITRPDSLTYQYTLKPTEERLTVRSLTVRLDAATRQPRQIDAVLKTSNALYSSERHLTLDSGPASEKTWRVQHYKLAGYQKLSYFDQNTFQVEGRLQ